MESGAFNVKIIENKFIMFYFLFLAPAGHYLDPLPKPAGQS